jgi:hypothetical protein
MNTLSLITAATIVSLASAASAQSFGGVTHQGSTVNLAFNFHNDGRGEPYSENYTTHLTATSRYGFGNDFGVAVSLGFQQETYEDSFYSERYLLDLNPYYSFGNGSVGVYYTAISHDYGNSASNDSQYGVTADYAINGFGIEAYAGVYLEEGDFNEDTFGIAGSYDVTDAAQVFVSHRRDVNSDGDWNGSVSLGATYDLQVAPISITGEITKLGNTGTPFDESDWNQFTIAASYSFGGGAQSIFRGLRAVDFFYD